MRLRSIRRSSGLFVLPVLAVAAALAACSLTLDGEGDYFRPAETNQGDGSTPIPDSGEPEVDGSTPDGDDGGDAAVGDASDGGDPIVGGGFAPASLMLYLSFDNDGDDQIAEDSSGANRDGLLKGDTVAIRDTGVKGKALVLNAAKNQYVQLPENLLVGLPQMSVTAWLNLKTGQVWDRLFDFNAGMTKWVYFSPTGWNFETKAPGTHFAISSGPKLDPEMQLTTTFPVGAWHHVAVVVAPPYILYYLDGVEKARRSDMTLAPADLGTTNQNWIGRSTFTGDAGTDPYLDGMVDEFRFYSGALTATEIQGLAAR